MKLDPKFTSVLQEIETTRGVPRERPKKITDSCSK